MGIRLFSSCRDDSHYDNGVRTEYVYIERPSDTGGNPDPRNFRITQHVQVGRFIIIGVTYPDCRNFEGKKILVFENVSIATLQSCDSLDPHFCESRDHPSPIARFMPTKDGWAYALKFCNNA